MSESKASFFHNNYLIIHSRLAYLYEQVNRLFLF